MEKIDYDETKRLAEKLKETCNENGQENDPQASAAIIHKLGLVYSKNTSDKISLIKSVGLLNSSLVRKPSNVAEIEKNLTEICQVILQKSNAQDQTADLITQGNYVKSQIESMRNKTKRALNEYKTHDQPTLEKTSELGLTHQKQHRIRSVKQIQFKITEHYKEIMKNICQYCTDIMGPPPCSFAIIGMGSLARKEITPYSDFEHIILLENQANYEDHLEYFRWFSVIFHTIILNVQETIIPSLNIKYLNDKNSDLGDWFFDTCISGISFDGMMAHACKFPLGRTQHTKDKPWSTELIKPVNKMLEYLSSDISLKNGYHLSDILTQTCFVYGNPALHVQFETGTEVYKHSKTIDQRRNEIKQQVEEDLDKFATRFMLIKVKPNDSLNVIQLFYRTSTLFVAALGNIQGTRSSSCFDIINELAKQHKISDYAKQKLSYVVAIACEIRLSVYMKENSQRDYISSGISLETIFDKILKFVDRESLISYFQITYCLQLKLIQILEITSSHIYSNAKLLNIAICNALRTDERMINLLENYFQSLADDTESKLVKSDAIEALDCFDKNLLDIEKQFENSALKVTSNVELNNHFIEKITLKIVQSPANHYEYFELLKIFIAIERYSSKSFFKVTKNDLWPLFIQILTTLSTSDDNWILERNRDFLVVCRFFVISSRHFPFSAMMEHFYHGFLFFMEEDLQQTLAEFQLALGILLSLNLEKSIHNYAHFVKAVSLNYFAYLLYNLIGTCSFLLYQDKESLMCFRYAMRMLEDRDVIRFLVRDFGQHVVNKLRIHFHCFNVEWIATLQKCGDTKSTLLEVFKLVLGCRVVSANDYVVTPTLNSPMTKSVKTKFVIDIICDFGLFYMKQNHFETAVTYFQQSYNICAKIQKWSAKKNFIRIQLLVCHMEFYQRERVERVAKCSKDSHTFFNNAFVITKLNSLYLTYVVQL